MYTIKNENEENTERASNKKSGEFLKFSIIAENKEKLRKKKGGMEKNCINSACFRMFAWS